MLLRPATPLAAPLAQLVSAEEDGGIQLAQLAQNAAAAPAGNTAQARDMGGVEGLRAYVTASYSVGEIDGTRASGVTVDYDAINLVGGVDYEVLRDEGGFDSLLFGAGFGYGDYDGEIDSTRTRIDTRGYTAMLYGSATFAKSAYADLTLAHSWLDYDYRRDTGTGDVTATPDGREWGGTLRVGYDFRPRISRFSPTRWVFGPFVQGQYLKADIDGFTERGTGGVTFEDQNAKSVTSQLGMHASVMRSMDWGALIFSGRMAWEHEYEDGADAVTLSSGTAPIDKVDPDYARLEFGVTALIGNDVALTADELAFAGDFGTDEEARVQRRLTPKRPRPSSTEEAQSAALAVQDCPVPREDPDGAIKFLSRKLRRDRSVSLSCRAWFAVHELLAASFLRLEEQSVVVLKSALYHDERCLEGVASAGLGPLDAERPRIERRASQTCGTLAEVLKRKGLPPALIVTAGCDPLADEGQAYAEALSRAGVAVEHRVYPGMLHGFINTAGALDQARDAVARSIDALKAALRG